jgi:hypothetical protein
MHDGDLANFFSSTGLGSLMALTVPGGSFFAFYLTESGSTTSIKLFDITNGLAFDADQTTPAELALLGEVAFDRSDAQQSWIVGADS